MFKRLTDTDIVHVPYKGNAETITGLIGGQVSITFTGVPPVVGLAKAGKVRRLVTTGRQRIPSLPEVRQLFSQQGTDPETNTPEQFA